MLLATIGQPSRKSSYKQNTNATHTTLYDCAVGRDCRLLYAVSRVCKLVYVSLSPLRERIRMSVVAIVRVVCVYVCVCVSIASPFHTVCVAIVRVCVLQIIIRGQPRLSQNITRSVAIVTYKIRGRPRV